MHKARTWVARRSARLLHTMLGPRPGEAFGILMYHRIADHPLGATAPTWNVTPERLRNQLLSLLSAGYEAWSLRKVLAYQRDSRPIPANVFVVTFDDGYRNNYSEAWPILKELRTPATVFLATAFLDTQERFPFDDWSDAGSSHVPPSSWLPLSTAECHEMHADELIDFGTHTHTHQSFLGRVDDFRQDLRISLDTLRQRFGIINPSFAAPFGHLSLDLIMAARREGSACVLSTCDERVHVGLDHLCWGRFCVENDDTLSTITAKLSGWHTPVDRALHALARPLVAMRGVPVAGMMSTSLGRISRPSGPGCASR
jgi:peptidoglycan/xylan/chitin deacetylase (PgdA/CDA1 family)